MMRLSGRQVQAFSYLVGQLHAVGSREDLVARLLDNLPRVVPSEFTTFGDVDLVRGQARWRMAPAGYAESLVGPSLQEIARHYARGNPLVRWYERTGDGRATCISDVISPSAFHRLPIYKELYRPSRVEDQCSIRWRWDTGRGYHGVAVSRSRRSFTQAERECMDLVRDHVLAAWTMLPPAPRYGTTGPGDEGPPRVLLQGRRPLDRAEPGAREALERWFGRGSCSEGRLPREIEEWLGANLGRLADRTRVPQPPAPLTLRHDGRCLTIRLVAGLDSGRRALHIEETMVRAKGAAPFGVTGRERQILDLLGDGRANEVIGTILGISPRTVEKHLEHIFVKLRVENRTEAAMAWEHARQVDPAPPSATDPSGR